MTMLKYKGYVGVIDVDPEAGVIHGTVIGTRDVITFEAATPKKITKAREMPPVMMPPEPPSPSPLSLPRAR